MFICIIFLLGPVFLRLSMIAHILEPITMISMPCKSIDWYILKMWSCFIITCCHVLNEKRTFLGVLLYSLKGFNTTVCFVLFNWLYRPQFTQITAGSPLLDEISCGGFGYQMINIMPREYAYVVFFYFTYWLPINKRTKQYINKERVWICKTTRWMTFNSFTVTYMLTKVKYLKESENSSHQRERVTRQKSK